MPEGLFDVWKRNREFVLSKTIKQIVNIAGDGNLLDGSETSRELREFLAEVGSDFLITYTEQCLDPGCFADNKIAGLVLQDVINEIGRRLDFEVIPGNYRRGHDKQGFDGLWKSPSGHSFIVESKTSANYALRIETLTEYREQLVKREAIKRIDSSILIVVGREDTSAWEQQVRGSRFAWDIRLVGVQALARMLQIKESLDNPDTQHKIHSILLPREFTKVDEIVNIVFSATEDLKETDGLSISESEDNPVQVGVEHQEVCSSREWDELDLRKECLAIIESKLNMPLLKKSRSSYASVDKNCIVTCSLSKATEKGAETHYLFGLSDDQIDTLKTASVGYAALMCGEPSKLLLIPVADLLTWQNNLYSTKNTGTGRIQWTLPVRARENRYNLYTRSGDVRVDPYLVIAGVSVPENSMAPKSS